MMSAKFFDKLLGDFPHKNRDSNDSNGSQEEGGRGKAKSGKKQPKADRSQSGKSDRNQERSSDRNQEKSDRNQAKSDRKQAKSSRNQDSDQFGQIDDNDDDDDEDGEDDEDKDEENENLQEMQIDDPMIQAHVNEVREAFLLGTYPQQPVSIFTKNLLTNNQQKQGEDEEDDDESSLNSSIDFTQSGSSWATRTVNSTSTTPSDGLSINEDNSNLSTGSTDLAWEPPTLEESIARARALIPSLVRPGRDQEDESRDDPDYEPPEISTTQGKNQGKTTRKKRARSVLPESKDDEEEDDDSERAQGGLVFGVYKAKQLTLNNREEWLTQLNYLFTRHKWNQVIQMGHSLWTDLRFPGYYYLRLFLLGLFTQHPSKVNFEQVKKLAAGVFTLCENKFEVLLELAVYLLQNDQFLPEKSFLAVLRRKCESFTSSRVRSREEDKLTYHTYCLYEEYLDFQEWRVLSDPRNLSRSRGSAEVASVLASKIKSNLQKLWDLEVDQQLHLDIAVLVLLHMFEVDNELPEALQMLQRYTTDRGDHLHGHIYLYHFLLRFPDLGTREMRLEALRKIARLSPDSKYVLRLAGREWSSYVTLLERIELVSDYLDYKSNWNSKRAWKLLSKLLSGTTLTPEESESVFQFFSSRIPHWERIHFDLSEFESALPRIREFYRKYVSDTGSICSLDSVDSERDLDDDDQKNGSRNEYYLYRYKVRFLEGLTRVMPLNSEKLTFLVHTFNDELCG